MKTGTQIIFKFKHGYVSFVPFFQISHFFTLVLLKLLDLFIFNVESFVYQNSGLLSVASNSSKEIRKIRARKI